MQLIIAVIPDYRAIAARVFNPEFMKIPDSASQEIVATLLRNGIEAIYFTDDVLAETRNYEFTFVYPNDHPGWGCVMPLANCLAARMQRFSTLLNRSFTPEMFTEELQNGWCRERYRFPEGVDIGPRTPGEIYTFPTILLNNKIIKSDPQAKILLIGNSFIQTPQKDSSLASALARISGYSVHEFRMDGNGPAAIIPMRLLLEHERYLKGKVVCLFPFSSSMFESFQFVDIAEYDRNMTLLSGMRLVRTFLPPTPDYVDLDKLQIPEGKKNIWKIFRQKFNGETEVVVSEENTKKEVFQVNVNQKIVTGTMLKITYIVSPQQRGQLYINDVLVPLMPTQYILEWKTAVAPLAADARSISIKLSGAQKDTLIAWKKIELYAP